MNLERNGSSAIAFDKCIFVFGGFSSDIGLLNSIEKYLPEYDVWSPIELVLRTPIHDAVVWNLGGCRVLILGGTTLKNVPNNRFDIYDLTTEFLSPE